MIYLVLAIGILLLIIIAKGKIKKVKTGTVTVITGAVKSGKTLLAVRLALKEYRINRLKWRIRKIFKKDEEEPLLYSNTPLAVKYTPITREILLRQKRMNYKSVVLLTEASLVWDNMLYKNNDINEQIMLFIKLFGHETKGGTLIIDTQAVGDLAIAVRRCISTRLYVDSTIRTIPFLTISKVKEERYDEEGATIQVNEGDQDKQYKYIIGTKSIYKKYDRYAFSVLTDNLKAENKQIDGTKVEDLKQRVIIGFREWKGVKKNDEENK